MGGRVVEGDRLKICCSNTSWVRIPPHALSQLVQLVRIPVL